MNCPNCRLINPETAQRCDCGYDFERKTILEPYIKSDLVRMTKSDKLRFALGITCCYLRAGLRQGWISFEGVGGTFGIAIVAVLVTYGFKGRKKPYNWREISWVFLLACIIWPVVRDWIWSVIGSLRGTQ